MRHPDEPTLRLLYVDQRKTTRAIGKEYGVSKTEVRRWLIEYGIPRRPSNRGLVSRGVQEPTAAELMQMVHGDHLSYTQIAARYGVDMTAVPHWLRKHGIPRPAIWQTRTKGRMRALPPVAELTALYKRGISVERIAEMVDASDTRVRKAMRDAGVSFRTSGWQQGKRWHCKDGHVVMSSYEMRVDDWLHDNGIKHEVDPRLPWHRQSRADFLVGDAYVEVWGVQNSAKYKQRQARKRSEYAARNCRLIELMPHDFSAKARGLWKRKLAGAFLQHQADLLLMAARNS